MRIEERICDLRVLFPRTDDALLAQLIRRCDALGLDPAARHIIPLQGALVVTIDGMRQIASMSGQYLGQTPVQWCGEDGVWVDAWLSSTPPAAARVGVLRQGFAQPLVATVMFREFNAGGNVWRQKPAHMIAKVAESHALRRAFPEHCAGLYTDDEMAASAPRPAAAPAPVAAPLAAAAGDDLMPRREVEAVLIAFARIAVSRDQVAEHLGHDASTMTRDEYHGLIALGQAMGRGLTWEQALEDLHGGDDVVEEEPQPIEE